MKTRPAFAWGKDARRVLPNEKRYLVGVSGGRDSVVLLHWLLSLGYERLVVCHFEHGLRGRAGQGDARFVEKLASKHDLPFVSGAADVAALAVRHQQSIEATARQERLKFFERVGRRRRCLTVLLGHQANDQVETFLLNLFRGAGRRGLGAMRLRSTNGKLTLVRPLLGVWREEIDRYTEEHQLKFRDDASNDELAARRNRLRHRIIPQLEKEFGRNLRATIWRAASILAEEEDFLEQRTPAGLTSEDELPLPALRQLAPALQRRVLRQWLRNHGINEVGFEVIEAALGLVVGADPAKINLARGRHLRRRAGKLFLE